MLARKTVALQYKQINWLSRTHYHKDYKKILMLKEWNKLSRSTSCFVALCERKKLSGIFSGKKTRESAFEINRKKKKMKSLNKSIVGKRNMDKKKIDVDNFVGEE